MKYSAHHDPIHDQVSVVPLFVDLFICLLRQAGRTLRPNSSFILRNCYSDGNLGPVIYTRSNRNRGFTQAVGLGFSL